MVEARALHGFSLYQGATAAMQLPSAVPAQGLLSSQNECCSRYDHDDFGDSRGHLTSRTGELSRICRKRLRAAGGCLTH